MCDRNCCCEITPLEEKLITMLEYDTIPAMEVTFRRSLNFPVILKSLKKTKLPSANLVQQILEHCKQALSNSIQDHGQLVDVTVKNKLFIFGDIHGQFSDLLQWFHLIGYPESSKNKFLFLGDYVDRGAYDIQTILLLLIYRVMYPKKVVLLRGNHEVYLQNASYGFKKNCMATFGAQGKSLWKLFNQVFDFLPRVGRVNQKIICMHGGISPECFQSNFKLNDLKKYKDDRGDDDHGILADLFWSDPSTHTGWKRNSRGISWTFGPDQVKKFHKKFKTSLIVRAHQVVEGFETFADDQLVTVFSAPHYSRMKNQAAVLQLDNKLNQTYLLFKP